MNGTIVFFSASGEKLADAVGMTGIAPANSEVISVNLSARDVIGAQKDNNALNILTKDNKKIVINDFFSNKKKKLVFDDGKDLFQTDYIAGENFNGLQFKSLSSIDALFDETDTALLGNDTLSWVVPLIAVAAVSGIALAVADNNRHKGSDDNEIGTNPDANLIAAKERANKAIDEMANLTAQQKADAHKAVEDATSVAQIDKILSDTTALNENSEDTPPSFLDQIIQAIDNIATSIWDVVTAIPKGILSAIKNVVSFISGDNFVTQFIDKVLDFIDSPSSIIDGIKGIASSIVDTITKAISDPIGTISGIISDIFDFVTAPFKGIIDTISSIFDAIIHPIDTITKVVSSVVDFIKDFVSDPWGTIVGKNSDSSPSAVKSALAELAHYSEADADADVVSLSEAPSARSLTPEKSATAPVNEEISDVLLSSLLNEGNSNDINLDNIIGEESDPVVVAERAPDNGENIGNTENHDASEQYVYQPLLNEDNYNLAAA